MQRLPANIQRSQNLHKDRWSLVAGRWHRHLVLSAMHSDPLQRLLFVGAASWLGVDAAGLRTLGGGRRAPRLVGDRMRTSFRIRLPRPRTSTRRRPITAHHRDRDHHRDQARDHHRDRDLRLPIRQGKEAMTLHCIA